MQRNARNVTFGYLRLESSISVQDNSSRISSDESKQIRILRLITKTTI